MPKLSDLIGHNKKEAAARQAMLEANHRYVTASTINASADEELQELQAAIAKWESAFLVAADAEEDDPQILQDADTAANDVRLQEKVLNSLEGAVEVRPDETFEEDQATIFFPGAQSLSEKEAREDAANVNADRVAQRLAATARLQQLREVRRRVFAALRREYGVATALDDAPAAPVDADDTGHYDDGHSFGWDAKKPGSRVLVGGGVLAVGGAIAAVLLLLNNGATSNSDAPTDANAPVQQESQPVADAEQSDNETAIAAVSPTGPILSGGYLETLSVSRDPAKHLKFIGMPDQILINVLITRDTTTGAISIVLTGPAPWVPLTGHAQFGPDFTSSGGAFEASGVGVVAGRPDVGVEFNGSLMASAGLQGNLTMGTNGALPTGESIDYTLSGTRQ